MSDFLAYLGDKLRRTYETIVEKPMPWRMIDTLATLEETCERRDAESADGARRDAADADTSSPRRPDSQTS
jgi:hypothetical protein